MPGPWWPAEEVNSVVCVAVVKVNQGIISLCSQAANYPDSLH